MRSTHPPLRLIGAVAVACLLGLTARALARTAWSEGVRLWAHRDDLGFDDLVIGVALVGLAATSLAACWLALVGALALASRGLGPATSPVSRMAARAADTLTPALVRRLLGVVCGAAVLLHPAPALSTGAAPVPGHPAAGPPSRGVAGSAHLPVPDRPETTPPGDRDWVRVRPGDCLWSIAARHLPRRAPDSAVAAAWPSWFAANRARIGPDPHLIHPGTRLRPPDRRPQTRQGSR